MGMWIAFLNMKALKVPGDTARPEPSCKTDSPPDLETRLTSSTHAGRHYRERRSTTFAARFTTPQYIRKPLAFVKKMIVKKYHGQNEKQKGLDGSVIAG